MSENWTLSGVLEGKIFVNIARLGWVYEGMD